jgi:hypothetical protein
MTYGFYWMADINYCTFIFSVILLIGSLFFAVRWLRFPIVMATSLSKSNNQIDHYNNIVIDSSCNDLNVLAREENVSLIISVNKQYDQMYGCPCIEANFPPTLITEHERRIWRFEKEQNVVRENILLLRDSLHSGAKHSFIP